jgi:hypothetical protein
MKLNSKLAQRLFLCVAPLVSGSVFVALPSMAATTATSEARVNIDNFSHNPLGVATLTDTNTFTSATNGAVSANANAGATFLADPSAGPTQAYNTSFSTVNGNGHNYLGEADSFAGLIGYDFLIGGGETFSFNFNSFLNLGTSIDNPSAEMATSAGNIAFMLFDSSDLNNPLDFFTLTGNLTTQGGTDFIGTNNSANVTLASNYTSSSFGGTQESAVASIQGWFSRAFDKLTHLTLVEGKVNHASACSWQ